MEQTMEKPAWVLPRGGVDEGEFSREFYMKHFLIYHRGAFFGPEGRLEEEQVKAMIFQELRSHIRSGIGARVESILGTLRYEAAQNCFRDSLEEDLFTIHAANGEYRLEEDRFSPVKQLTRFRLPVNYNPQAPEPKKWLSFLEDLLHPEDIPTLQEYMGYCLIHSTLGQKMLLITGKGGEGKSRIGVVMKALLGSINKVEKNPFARADLEHQLLMVDDDLKMEALDQTNYLKSIITAELPMDLERKGIQSYQGNLFVRFLAFGNGNLQALHDCSYGFFRRQIILEARERPVNRKDDPYLGYQLQQEAEGILLWCIDGLKRLILNDFRFTQSKRARENLLRSMSMSNNITEFFRSEGYIRLDPLEQITSRQLYQIYQDWCQDNAYIPLKTGSFYGFVNQNLQTYQLENTRTIPIGNGKYARGYKGMAAASRF